jgi:hypothetical protein
MTTHIIRDPFTGKDVEISDRLTDRLRGRYAIGPLQLDGEPEFGWRQYETPPIQHKAADCIEQLEARLDRAVTRGLDQVEYITKLEAALREYESDYCEGWCRDAPPQAMFDCGGCRARAAIAPEQNR